MLTLELRICPKNGLLTSQIMYIEQHVHDTVSRYITGKDDAYISIAGTIGRVSMVPSDFDGANLTENAAKICEIAPAFNPQFLMYFLKSYAGQGQIAAKAGGTSQPKLALYRIEEIEVPRIDRFVQNKIVEIASKYDYLIENNRRRIQLLEESARLLYQEWFVHLRFPGYEHIKIADGVPDGWSKNKLGQILTFNYGKALKADNRISGLYPVYGSSGIVGNHEKITALANHQRRAFTDSA
ncbi:MAG: restriction endonuclease subunit S [Methylococcaceae bacterium]|nr:restriction endonuclease subunit S [Methylococcaceae bacterium]